MEKIKNLKLKNDRVLVRCDFQVPLSLKGEILDDFKIRASLPTIKYLIKEKAKVILVSHWKPMESFKKAESLKFILPKLENLLKKRIFFSDQCIGQRAEEKIEKMRASQVLLLENLRAHKEEEENSDDFARQLAKLADIYINDAFAVSHRLHASLVGIPKYLPSYPGFLLEKEIKALEKIKENPQKPLVAIIGGAKVETKTKVIDNISKNADFILVGGLIANEIQQKNIEFKNPKKIIFPVDNFCAPDISDKTVKLFKEKIKTAKSIFWTGPLGKVEKKEFERGTLEIVKAIIESESYSVAGGGETNWFLNNYDFTDKFSHVSTGGGAMIAYLSGKKLPGLEALR